MKDYARIPIDLHYEVSRPAVLLFCGILDSADSAGYCSHVAMAAVRVGLTRKEWAPLIAELVTAGYLQIVPTPNIYGGTTDAGQLLKIEGPARLNRVESAEWTRIRRRVFKRDEYTCQYCGDRDELECDHVIPISQGGTNEMGNLITACGECNRSKRTKMLHEWRGRKGAMQ